MTQIDSKIASIRSHFGGLPYTSPTFTLRNTLEKYNGFTSSTFNTKRQIDWYYTKNQKQQGPATKDDLLRMLDDGTLATTELA